MEKVPGGLNISTACKTTVKFKTLSCQTLYQDGVYFYGVPTANRFLKINETAGTTTINGVINPSNTYTINVNITQNSQSITIPLATGGVIGTTINWGDGMITTGTNSHIYTVPGIYVIKVTGTIPTFNFINPLFSNIISIPTIGITLTDMTQMFTTSTITSLPGLSTWDTSNVTDMQGMFYQASLFNQPIENWNTSKVTNMYLMFSEASLFNQPIGNWDTSNVSDMEDVFNSASSFDQPLNFNTFNVTNMRGMFYAATSFDKPLNFNTSNVTSMSSMFSYASSFDQPLNFNTFNVTDMFAMFNAATSFNQPLNFNTFNVTDMANMFNGAVSFNQPLNFNISNVTTMQLMFFNNGLDSSNASTFLVNCAFQAPNIKNTVPLGLSSSVFNYGTNTPPLTSAGSSAATTLTSAPYSWTIS